MSATAPTNRNRDGQQDCGFSKVETLEHNIGYIKLDSFRAAASCESQARSAMAAVNGADALIFDMRENRGGYREMTALIAALH